MASLITGTSSIYSTPYSNDVASASGANLSCKGTVEKKEDLYIEHELKATANVPIKNFLSAFLNKPPEDLLTKDSKVDRVANDPAITQMLENYCSMKSANERQRYGPFVELANEILTLLCDGKQPPILFVRIQPQGLRGLRGNTRTLDVVVVNSLDSVKDGKWRNYPYQSDPRWTWADVIFAFEFKQVSDVIERLINAPDSSKRPDTQTNEPLAAPDAGPIIPSVESVMSSLVSTESTSVKPVQKQDRKGDVRRSQGKSAKSIKRKQALKVSSARPSGSGIASAPLVGAKRGFTSDVGSVEKQKKRVRLQTDDTSLTTPLDNAGSSAPPVNQVPSYPSKDLRKQGARYAIEQISYSSNLRHVFNMLVIDGHIWMCYYDHAGVIQSRESLNFVDDLYTFVLLLNGMMTMSKGDRGVLELTPKYEAEVSKSPFAEDRTNAPKTSTLTVRSSSASCLMVSNHVVTLTECLARIRPHGLLGRATEVDKGRLKCGMGCVDDKCPQGRVFAVKRSWPAKTQKSEVEIIDEGRTALDDFAHHFLWILQIMHRDVSAANFMVRVLADGTVRGVLNDWDL